MSWCCAAGQELQCGHLSVEMLYLCWWETGWVELRCCACVASDRIPAKSLDVGA